MHMLFMIDSDADTFVLPASLDGVPRVGDGVCLVEKAPNQPAVYSKVSQVVWSIAYEAPQVVLEEIDLNPVCLFEAGWEVLKASGD